MTDATPLTSIVSGLIIAPITFATSWLLTIDGAIVTPPYTILKLAPLVFFPALVVLTVFFSCKPSPPLG